MAETRGYPHAQHVQRQGANVIDNKEGVTERRIKIRDIFCLLDSPMEGTGHRVLQYTQQRA